MLNLSDVEFHDAKVFRENEISEFKSDYHEFLCEQELMDEDGNLDNEALDRVCEAMTKSYDEEEEDY